MRDTSFYKILGQLHLIPRAVEATEVLVRDLGCAIPTRAWFLCPNPGTTQVPGIQGLQGTLEPSACSQHSPPRCGHTVAHTHTHRCTLEHKPCLFPLNQGFCLLTRVIMVRALGLRQDQSLLCRLYSLIGEVLVRVPCIFFRLKAKLVLKPINSLNRLVSLYSAWASA